MAPFDVIRPDGIRRGPPWLPVLVTAFLIAAFGYLRLAAYPDHFVPLASVLALLVCLWHGDLRLLWTMVAAFAGMIVYKAAFLVPQFAAPGNQEWLFGGMQFANLMGAAAAIHFVIVLTGRLQDTVALLERSNAEIEANNEELAAREEEVTQQNEELQSQTEELEQQTEELNSQAEELRTLNEHLAERERILHELLDATAAAGSERETLDRLGQTIERVLGDHADGAAVLQRDGDEMRVLPLFGMAAGTGSRIDRERTLGEMILSRGRAGSLADIALRPDLDAPELVDGRSARSLAAAPMQVEGAHGALELYSAEPGEWSDMEVQIVQWLGEQCGRMLATAAMRAERENLLESERAARTEAERANHAKDEFVSMLSHELRTPLHAILGWSAILRMTGDSNPDEVARGLDVIERNARHQGQLLSDLLDISRFMAGKLHLDVQAVDLRLIIERELESVRQSAESKEIHLERHVDGIEGQVMGDPARLQQVVWNLLSNAIKFTPEGGSVRIGVIQDEGRAVITVSDDGEGIEPSLLPSLFQRYRQADGSATRPHGGLGLGLAIVKSIVELHSGTVEARSEGIGRGSTFTVRLPIRTTEARDEGSTQHHDTSSQDRFEIEMPRLDGLTILVVDDERDAREVVGRILTGAGAIVHAADSGEQAIDMLDDIGPDVLISDIGMPSMDGYALIRAIRDRTADRDAPLPAIALTAFARSEDRTRAMLAGYHTYVAKPVEPAELVTVVASLGRAASFRMQAREPGTES